MSGDIFLNIDTIVLRGLNHIDRYALAEAVQQALLEQLSLHPTLTAADLSRVRTNITLPNNCGSEQLGMALGQSLSKVITNNNTTHNSAANPLQGGQHHD